MRSQFKVGDKAVYRAHGVCVIKDIESMSIGPHSQDFYVLQILSSGATLRVPTAGGGMRGLISRKEISAVYDILKSPGHVSRTTWNRRFREFNEKLNTGSVKDVAEVLRDLCCLQEDKDLSDGEKELMKKAISRLATEISASSNKKEESVESEIAELLHA